MTDNRHELPKIPSDEEMELAIERWHQCHDVDKSLHEFIGITWEQMKQWVEQKK